MWVKGCNHQFVVWTILSNNPTTVIDIPEGISLLMLEFHLDGTEKIHLEIFSS
jgi:hypothetical protein